MLLMIRCTSSTELNIFIDQYTLLYIQRIQYYLPQELDTSITPCAETWHEYGLNHQMKMGMVHFIQVFAINSAIHVDIRED